jgi:hypothetical protein
MSHTGFENPDCVADFHNLKVGADIQLDNSVFAGSAHLSSVDIVGSLIVSQARFSNKGGKVLFDHAKIGSDIRAHGARFDGQALFDYAQISGGLDISNAEFNGTWPATFVKVTVGSDIRAQSVKFVGEARFDYVKVTGGMDITDAEFNGNNSPVKFTGVHVSGTATLTRAKVPAGISFENASFDRLEIKHLSPWKWEKSAIGLAGLTYRDVTADDDPLTSSDKLIQFANFAKYDPRTYERLEAYFVGQGELGKANDAFIEGKCREREEVLLEKQNFLGWSGSLLLDCLVGYGRIPAFALIWSTIFVT